MLTTINIIREYSEHESIANYTIPLSDFQKNSVLNRSRKITKSCIVLNDIQWINWNSDILLSFISLQQTWNHNLLVHRVDHLEPARNLALSPAWRKRVHYRSSRKNPELRVKPRKDQLRETLNCDVINCDVINCDVIKVAMCHLYGAFHRFGQAKFPNGSSFLG